MSPQSQSSNASSSPVQIPPGPRLIPLDQALRSRGLRLHYTTWLRLVRSKGLPAKKVGGRHYIDLADLDAWIAEQGVAAVTTPARLAAPRAMRREAADAILAQRRSERPRAASPSRKRGAGK